jgi:hypothetical protein
VLGRGELGKREVEGREIEEKRDISFAWQTRETKERELKMRGAHTFWSLPPQVRRNRRESLFSNCILLNIKDDQLFITVISDVF